MSTPLEQTMPVYHFHNRHSRWIDASPQHVWQALATLTLDDLTITRPLVALRHLGSSPLEPGPLLTTGPLQLLHTDVPTYAIGGAVARPWQRRPPRRSIGSLEEFAAFAEPGWTKYLTDFHLVAVGGGVQLTTETRGYSTDSATRRRFALYWAVIGLGSGLVRRDLLATVARVAVAASSGPPRTA